MRHRYFLTIACLCLVWCCNASSAEPKEPPPSPPVTSVGNGGVLRKFETESYTLRTGDKIDLVVLALPELPTTYEVRVDGSFFHPVVGPIQASGRTLGDIRSELKSKLAKELKFPEFRLGLQTVSAMEISVLGEATSQGAFSIGAGGTVLDALAKAGGLTDKADTKNALILRGSEQIEISLEPVEGQGLTRLRPGDVLYIKPGLQVSVSGEVSKPGPYNVSQGGGSPWDAIIAAGGAKEEAALTRVKLIRPTFEEPLVIDLSPGNEAGVPNEARQLQAGDIVVVPARQAAVLGAVLQPGPAPLRKEESLLDLLSSKITNESDIKHVLVVRAEDVRNNRDKKEEYNLSDFFKEGKREMASVPIRDGDLVYIPSKKQGNGLFNGFNILSIFSLARLFF